MNTFCFRISAIALLMSCLVGTVQAQAPAPATGIRVQVYGIHFGGNLVYNYKVINNGDTPFNNFTIGSNFKHVEDGELPQFYRRPLGWQYGITGETGTEIILAPDSTRQPPNWKSSMLGQQDIDFCYLKWLVPRGDGSNDIRPGQSLAGFSVTVPLVDKKLPLLAIKGKPVYTGPDEMYLKGGFKVGFGSEKKFQEVWGTLELVDITPPSLTVTLSPDKLWPANGKLVPITATITVKDDYDPQPKIQLESITANETLTLEDAKEVKPGSDDRHYMLRAKREGKNKAGRIYTVTYSATDGSGNKATASATVTVPHDQGK